MKRYYRRIHGFTCLVLGAATGSWASLAVSQSSIYYQVLAIIAAITLILNTICIPDNKGNSSKDEE